MFFNKKGEYKTLMNIILILIAAFVLFLLVPNILEGSSRGADIASCRNWAILQSSVKIADIQLKEFSNPCVTF